MPTFADVDGTKTTVFERTCRRVVVGIRIGVGIVVIWFVFCAVRAEAISGLMSVRHRGSGNLLTERKFSDCAGNEVCDVLTTRNWASLVRKLCSYITVDLY